MAQRFTDTDTALIQRARRKRRDVIVLREDEHWLAEYSSRPKDMLWRMARRGALISLGAGRYAIPVLGSDSAAFKAWQPMLHARLAPHGSYYLGGLSALVEHRLTDVSESSIFAVVGFWHSDLQEGGVTVAGRPVHAVRTRRAVFTEELGVERIRLSRSEHYLRSDPTRTLVDCLWHPELCGATETWITAWGRSAETALRPAASCRYALALGPSVARRVGLMLDLIGHGEVAREVMPPKVRRGDRVALLSADGPSATDTTPVDPFWRVAFNVPRDRIEGWLAYGK
jgi:predicted transcriptional regulator of viral defense system